MEELAVHDKKGNFLIKKIQISKIRKNNMRGNAKDALDQDT